MYSPYSSPNLLTTTSRTALPDGDGASEPDIPPEIRHLSDTIAALSQQINALIEQREAAIERRYELMQQLRTTAAEP